ncbi:probable LRR receptor-like serine/threonine-protein kinase At4g31250 [Humulus lupulus]|uniref:probable LRR receptor-like serine/threonine-protein kinase At4g31250 n=1 Tax=Humulus lupulus TaxID=3486 RepID=UPI002B409455|nr:probable LRR receptor-like serine/threonine-protein kinase At4g31250 [Humulus lupulus]
MAYNNNNNNNNNYLVTLLLIPTILVLLLSFAAQPWPTAGAVTDAEILLQFKKSLSNDRVVLANWNTSVPLCVGNTNSSNWTGLTCMNGNLYGLRLENMGLSGTIDVETLSKLSISLRSLSVKGNHFGGGIPQVRLLGALRSLYLSYNEFSGVIPDDTFEGMAYLKKVHLARNEFDGVLPKSLVRLSKLMELNLEDNRFTGRIPEFPQQDWKELSFAYNQFEGPIPASLSRIDRSAFLGNKDLCGPPLGSCKSSSNKKKHIILIAIIVTVVIAAITLILFLCTRRTKSSATKVYEQFGAAAGDTAETRSDHSSHGDGGYMKGGEKGSLHFVMKERERFEMEDLLRASAEVLGSGSFGSSYKALLLSGPAMVVKRFSHMYNVGREEFHDYMAKLGRLSHPNLLPLVAYYYRKEEKLLISDFVENGSLASHLHGKRPVGKAGLDWPTRLNIIKGISRGLIYLYKGFPDVALPHGHLKSSNVLLDQNFTPILTEYALVPLTNKDHAHRLMAAFMSPEFSSNNRDRRVCRKTDIWSLGILILEILTGKFPENFLKPADGKRSSATDLAAWVNSVVREEWTGEVFDKEMRGGEGEMLKLLKIGMSCCERRVERRLDWREAAERIEELRERDTEEDYSSYVTDWDVLSDDGFSFSVKH